MRRIRRVPLLDARPDLLREIASLVAADECIITEMRNPDTKSRIFEFARANTILVPTCSCAYVPARIALREHRDKNYGGDL